jgi:hypothetical protein
MVTTRTTFSPPSEEIFATRTTIDRGRFTDDPPGEFDVLCGKGRERSKHVGNERFKAIVALNASKYSRAGNRRSIKTQVVKAVYREVRSIGSRFFKLSVKGGRDWVEIRNERIVCDKIGHALRDQSDAILLVADDRRATNKEEGRSSAKTRILSKKQELIEDDDCVSRNVLAMNSNSDSSPPQLRHSSPQLVQQSKSTSGRRSRDPSSTARADAKTPQQSVPFIHPRPQPRRPSGSFLSKFHKSPFPPPSIKESSTAAREDESIRHAACPRRKMAAFLPKDCPPVACTKTVESSRKDAQCHRDHEQFIALATISTTTAPVIHFDSTGGQPHKAVPSLPPSIDLYPCDGSFFLDDEDDHTTDEELKVDQQERQAAPHDCSTFVQTDEAMNDFVSSLKVLLLPSGGSDENDDGGKGIFLSQLLLSDFTCYDHTTPPVDDRSSATNQEGPSSYHSTQPAKTRFPSIRGAQNI